MDRDTITMLTIAEPLWWLAFFCAAGLCIGSFLNAVIYRLPRNISLSDPRWSFCPVCDRRLRWYDNLPLVGFLRLKGRCRDCHAPISPRYPLVEIIGAIITVLVLDALIVAQTHQGLASDAWGMSWRLAHDWPLVVGHLVLFACLFGMAAVDLENYWVDIRFTNVATLTGFAMHMLWTPPQSADWTRPGVSMAAVTVVMTIAILATVVILRRFQSGRAADDAFKAAMDAESARQSPRMLQALQYDATVDDLYVPKPPTVAEQMRMRLLGMGLTAVTGLVMLQLVVFAIVAAKQGDADTVPMRWLPALVLLFLLIVGGSAQVRESDSEIHEAIESEAPSARRLAGVELLTLLPTVLIGGAVLVWLMRDADARSSVAGWMNWRAAGDWRPLLGLSTAATGFVIGGAVGWLVRIPATLIMGKEAFGTGDIHILAAAGCVAGWPVAVIGFVLCSFLALAGWVLSIPLKRTRIIALVPWLALGMLLVTLYYNPIVKSQMIQNVVYVFNSLTGTPATSSVQ